MLSRDSDKREPSLGDYARILYRNRLLVASVLLVTLIVTGVFTFTAKRVYEAGSTISYRWGGVPQESNRSLVSGVSCSRPW